MNNPINVIDPITRKVINVINVINVGYDYRLSGSSSECFRMSSLNDGNRLFCCCHLGHIQNLSICATIIPELCNIFRSGYHDTR